MSTKNRGDRIQLLLKVATKHFSPVPAPEDRSVLEHLLYACCLEDASFDAADEGFHRLQESFFDWNEVRVTTISELRETLHNLPDPAGAAVRIKHCLQSLFETRYSFDLDDMVKMNQGKAVQELENLNGMTRFVQNYVTQNALGGHSIPLSKSILEVMKATEIVTDAEASKWQVPGLERTIPKTKGAEFFSCLHQLAIQHLEDPSAKTTLAILKEAGAKLESPAKPAPATKATKKAAAKKPTESKTPVKKTTKSKKAESAKATSSASTKKAATKSAKRKPK